MSPKGVIYRFTLIRKQNDMPIESINADLCIGCGTCVARCPMDILRLNTQPEVKQEQSPCSAACPLGVNQREYHNLIELDMLDEAAELLAKYHPMPSITGRICPHPCETPCSRAIVDSAININGLEQYLGDYLLEQGSTASVSGDKVAVIGSGPAGLAAAYHLAQQSYSVTVFEREQKLGGLLRTSIPSFRLPEEVLDKQIEAYKQMGIEFKAGVSISDASELEAQGYKAVIAATGASKPFTLSVPGNDAEGITSAISFLYDVKAGTPADLTGKKVAVIGGGSVSLDAARTAVRLGADAVNVICLERVEPGHKDTMLALTEEIEDAIDEGVVINTSRSVSSFETQAGNVSAVKMVECLSVRDDGRFNPVYGETVLDETIDADFIILAIGQTADAELVPTGFATNERGQILSDKVTMQAANSLFAIGDAVTGPTTVVVAAAAGKRAALTVDRFLKGEELAQGLETEVKQFDISILTQQACAEVAKAPRVERRRLPIEECKTSFAETLKSFDWNEAAKEAERCLTCGSNAEIAFKVDCQICNICAHYCPVDAIEITPERSFPPITAWG
ncbi:FAD-dependent oxidoreductase [Vibrio sp. WJH972]